jgi:hypothetical protein
MMKGKWMVTSNIIGGHKKYAIYRLLDVSEADHSGNREFAGEYVDGNAENYETLKFLCEELNRREEKEC